MVDLMKTWFGSIQNRYLRGFPISISSMQCTGISNVNFLTSFLRIKVQTFLPHMMASANLRISDLHRESLKKVELKKISLALCTEWHLRSLNKKESITSVTFGALVLQYMKCWSESLHFTIAFRTSSKSCIRLQQQRFCHIWTMRSLPMQKTLSTLVSGKTIISQNHKFRRKPEDRMTALELLEHPFIANIKQTNIIRPELEQDGIKIINSNTLANNIKERELTQKIEDMVERILSKRQKNFPSEFLLQDEEVIVRQKQDGIKSFDKNAVGIMDILEVGKLDLL